MGLSFFQAPCFGWFQRKAEAVLGGSFLKVPFFLGGFEASSLFFWWGGGGRG